MSADYSPLSSWLDRRHPLPPFSKIKGLSPKLEIGGWVALVKRYPIHEASEIPAQSLSTSWKEHKEYVELACDLINSDEPGWLDREEVKMIRGELGQPHEACLPIYMVTVTTKGREQLVYIGETSSERSRFAGGHAIFSKLHDPKYYRSRKDIYLCTVMLTTDDEYLPLEWVHPLSSALELLRSIEAQLIYDLKPELNLQGKKRHLARKPFVIHIQNFLGHKQFLDDHFSYPIK